MTGGMELIVWRGVQVLAGVAAAGVVLIGQPGIAEAASSWVAEPVPSSAGGLNDVSCVSQASCEAVGLSGAVRWDGTSWTVQDIPTGSGKYPPLTSISCTADFCMAVGYQDAALWNGSSWALTTLQPPPAGTAGGVSTVSCSTDTCLAVGYVQGDNDTSSPFSELWNGTSWATVPLPGGLAQLSGVSCVSTTDCVAVGGTGTEGDAGPLIFRWNGTRWGGRTVLANPPGTRQSRLQSVSCLAAHGCTAVGVDFTPRIEADNAIAEHENGSTWTLQSVPLPAKAIESQLTDISCTPGGCTAAGAYWVTGPTSRDWDGLAEFYNGTNWSVERTITPTYHRALDGMSCLAAHTCTGVGGATFYLQHPRRIESKPLAAQQ